MALTVSSSPQISIAQFTDVDSEHCHFLLATTAQLEGTAASCLKLRQLLPQWLRHLPLGSVFSALQKLAEATENASVNKRACERVGVWSVAVQAALEGAAPALLAAGDTARGTESFSDLLDAFESQIGALRAMTQSYINKRYIVRVLTSGQFKAQFEETMASAKEVLDAVSLVMQSAQLQLAANGGGGGYTAADNEKALSDFQANMDESMSITVEIDEKLDALVAMQAEMLEEQKKQSKVQGKTDVKIDALLDIVISLSAEGGHAPAIITLDFEVTSTMSQEVNMFNPMNQGITTHGRTATHWSVVAEGPAAKGDVVTEAEFQWLGAYLSRAMDHDFGLINCMQVMGMGPVIMDTLSPKLIEAAKTAASALRWGDRNVELVFKRMSADLMTGKAMYTISWLANGIKPRPDDFDIASLPEIPQKHVQEAATPNFPGMEAITGAPRAKVEKKKVPKTKKEEVEDTKGCPVCAIL